MSQTTKMASNTPNGAGGNAGATSAQAHAQTAHITGASLFKGVSAAKSHATAVASAAVRSKDKYAQQMRARIAEKVAKDDLIKAEQEASRAKLHDAKNDIRKKVLQEAALYAIGVLATGSIDPEVIAQIDSIQQFDEQSMIARSLDKGELYTTFKLPLPNDRVCNFTNGRLIQGDLLPIEQRYFAGFVKDTKPDTPFNDIQFNDPSKNAYPLLYCFTGPPKDQRNPQKPYGAEALHALGATPALETLKKFLEPLGFSIYVLRRCIHITLDKNLYEEHMAKKQLKAAQRRNRAPREKRAMNTKSSLADYIR